MHVRDFAHARMLKCPRTYVSSSIEISGSFPETHNVIESGLSLTIGLKEGLIADTVFSQNAQNRELPAWTFTTVYVDIHVKRYESRHKPT